MALLFAKKSWKWKLDKSATEIEMFYTRNLAMFHRKKEKKKITGHVVYQLRFLSATIWTFCLDIWCSTAGESTYLCALDVVLEQPLHQATAQGLLDHHSSSGPLEQSTQGLLDHHSSGGLPEQSAQAALVHRSSNDPSVDAR